MEDLVLEASTILIVTFLLVISLLLIGVFLYLVSVPLQTIFRKNKTLSKLSASQKFIEEFDAYMESGNTEGALLCLRMAPFLEIPSSFQHLGTLREHYQELLSRYLIVSDTLNTRAPNLGRLEDLLNERNELLQLLFKSQFNYEVLLGKRKSEGKSLPNWTKNEFEKKENDLRDELKKNLVSFNSELHYFFKHLESAPSGEVLIH